MAGIHGVRVYPTGVTLRGAKAAKHEPAGFPYTIERERNAAPARSEFGERLAPLRDPAGFWGKLPP